jgi:hypoxanthine phosphoribosyltransferase
LQIHDLFFEEFISESLILGRVEALSTEINSKYADRDPILIGVLNGSFMFFSDLLKNINIPCETSFIRVNSYQNETSSGKIQEILGLNIDVKNRHVLLIEDIIDTGNTMAFLIEKISALAPASIELCTLLYKPEPFQYTYPIKYIGFEIENKFVIGYGLDYNEKGRNLRSIYIKKTEKKT